jgi:hypothetical protein
MTTFQSLYASRCVQKNDKLVPVFWKPQPVEHSPLTLFADDTCPVSEEWGCESVISRIISLGLAGEIPVGEFLKAASKRDLPSNPVLSPLMQSHVADEAAHDLSFRLVKDKYTVKDGDIATALDITSKWQSVDVHPMVPAAALELGVFLCTLGAMRLFGGNVISHMAAQIARDEFRHVAVNTAIVKALRLDFGKVEGLIKETLWWTFEGLDIPESETGVKVNRDFFMRSSQELMETRRASDLDDLISYTNHFLPFEISNQALYTRGV